MRRRNAYHRYRGSRDTSKTFAYIVLIVIIVVCALYLIAQNFYTYDLDGERRLNLPSIFQNEYETEELMPITDAEIVESDVVVDIEEAQEKAREFSELHSVYIPADGLQNDAETILAKSDESLMFEVKDINGVLSFKPSFEISDTVKAVGGYTRENLENCLASQDHYMIAKMCALCDCYFVRSSQENALTIASGSYFYDGNGGKTWLNPASAGVKSYLSSLCKEYVQMGFEEIVLDYFSYPTTGHTELLDVGEGVDRIAVMESLAKYLRDCLPDNVALSVVLRSDFSPDYGLSLEMLTSCFDRIYIPSDLDSTELLANLDGTYSRSTQIVFITDTIPATGSYVLDK